MSLFALALWKASSVALLQPSGGQTKVDSFNLRIVRFPSIHPRHHQPSMMLLRFGGNIQARQTTESRARGK